MDPSSVLRGYADGLMLLGQALALYWDHLWPSLNDGGEFDPFYRINALAALSDKSDLTTLRQPLCCAVMAMS